MRLTLLAAAVMLAAAGAVFAARDDGASSRRFEAIAAQATVVGPAYSREIAPAVVEASAADVVIADGAPVAYSLGGSSETSVIVSDAQRAAIRRQFSLLVPSNLAPSTLRDLKVGEALAREKVRISPLPSEIARIVPKYGAYEYFVTDGGALVIVDPAAYRIVDIIGS